MHYFEKYKSLIKNGDIVVGKAVKLAMKRIERYQKQYTFKQQEADRRILFIENECSNTKGQNGMLELALPQKVWLETAFGFYYSAQITHIDPNTLKPIEIIEERRLIHELPIVVSRGSGKTTLGAAVGIVGQTIDGEYGADVQILAYDRTQAAFAYEASRAMANNENSILRKMRDMELLSSTKRGMLYRPTNSLMSIKTSDYESLDGTNAHFNIFDEVHTYDEDFIKVVNDGSSRKRKNWMSWYITTNGTKRGKVFDKYFAQWMDILTGKIDNDSIMPWIYKLDGHEEIRKPKMWVKAIPMLGIITEREVIEKDIEMAQNDPVAQAEIMAKTFNLPVNNYLAYFTNEECRGNSAKFKPNLFLGNDYQNARCVLAGDLSDVSDICSFSFLVPDGENMQFVNQKYMPRVRIEALPKEQRDQYLAWEADGILHIHEKDSNEPKYIFDDLCEFMRERYIFPVMVGFDPWGAKEMKDLIEAKYGDIVEMVPQTAKVLSNPLKTYKAKLKAGKIIFDDPIARWCHGNVNVKVDANNNIFPNKKMAKNKIDVFASMLDAFVVYLNNKEDLQHYFS